MGQRDEGTEENSYEDNRANSYLQQRGESRLRGATQVESGSGFGLVGNLGVACEVCLFYNLE